MFHLISRAVLAVLSLLLPHLAAKAAPYSAASPIEDAQLRDALKLDGELFHVQGLAVENGHIWVTSVDRKGHRGYLHEFDRATGAFLRRLELTDGARYHPGGISILDRSIWVPVAENAWNSSTVLEEIDADSLQVVRRIHVADHLGCVAASASNLIAANWNSTMLSIIDLTHNAPVRTMPNPSATRYQDMKFSQGQLVAAGSLNGRSGAIDWIDWQTMTLTRTLRTGATRPENPSARARPYTGEGMAIDGRELYVVPEDGPSRMFHFRLDDQNPGSSFAAVAIGN